MTVEVVQDGRTVVVSETVTRVVDVVYPGNAATLGTVRYDVAQSLTGPQKAQAWANIGGAAFVLATALTGFSAASGGAITAADTVLTSIGKIEYRLADLEDGALVGPMTITANSSSATLTLVNNGAGLAMTTTGGITAGTFTGALVGNAATATKLITARAINGVNFDGSAAITVTAAASTLTGTTLNAPVVSSSLTSVGTLTSLAVGGAQTITLNSASTGLTITQSGAGAALAVASGQSTFPAGTSSAASVRVGSAETGLSSSGTSLYLMAGGRIAVQIVQSSVTGNYINLESNTTPLVYSGGPGTNIDFFASSKGTGNLNFFTGTGSYEQLRISNVTSAVNRAQIQGSATGLSVVYGVSGSDPNAPVVVASKGTAAVGVYTNGGANAVAFFNHIASSVNYLSFFPAATGGAPTQYAEGADANPNFNHSLKGGGSHLFYTASTSVIQYSVSHTANAVNRVNVTGGGTGNPASFSVVGSDSNRSVTFTTAGTGTVRFSNKIHPGTPAAAVQTTTGLSAGTGAPSNSDGSDTDFYFRSDGGALTSIYQKRAGAWVGLI